ncbi:MAG: hypothetical protein KGL01_05965, partial [Betaproteobacteria bacterium]|nr:hypothetical protein [Betaproteobacteria bacterium]
MPKKPILLFLFCLLSGCLLLASPLHAMQITLSVADITAPGLAARGVRVVLAQDGAADLSIAELRWTEKIWRKVHVHCAEFLLSSVRMTCRRGKLDSAPDLPFEVGYNFSAQRMELQVSAAGNERWQVNADFRVQPWRAEIRLRNAQGRRLAAMLPPAWPSLVQGVLNGTLRLQGGGAGVSRAYADLQLADLAFADAAGLHAAEKLAGTLHLEATRAGQQWDWRGAVDWQGGELFW